MSCDYHCYYKYYCGRRRMRRERSVKRNLWNDSNNVSGRENKKRRLVVVSTFRPNSFLQPCTIRNKVYRNRHYNHYYSYIHNKSSRRNHVSSATSDSTSTSTHDSDTNIILRAQTLNDGSALGTQTQAIGSGLSPNDNPDQTDPTTTHRFSTSFTPMTTTTPIATTTAAPSTPNAMYQIMRELGSGGGIVLTILLILSSFFALAETSISTLWPWKVMFLARSEGKCI